MSLCEVLSVLVEDTEDVAAAAEEDAGVATTTKDEVTLEVTIDVETAAALVVNDVDNTDISLALDTEDDTISGSTDETTVGAAEVETVKDDATGLSIAGCVVEVTAAGWKEESVVDSDTSEESVADCVAETEGT